MSQQYVDEEWGVPYYFYEETPDGGRQMMRRLNGVSAPHTLTLADIFPNLSGEPDAGDYEVGD